MLSGVRTDYGEDDGVSEMAIVRFGVLNGNNLLPMEGIGLLRFEMKGFDALERRLKQLSRRAQELDGVNQVSFLELFPPAFIQRHSNLDSLESLIRASGFRAESQKDFEAIPDDEWDAFISTHTTFSNWHEMLEAATAEWVKSRLGL